MSIAARLTFGGLEQAVQRFEETIGHACSCPGSDTFKMGSNHPCDIFHGLDFRAHEVGAPLGQHPANDIALPLHIIYRVLT